MCAHISPTYLLHQLGQTARIHVRKAYVRMMLTTKPAGQFNLGIGKSVPDFLIEKVILAHYNIKLWSIVYG